MKTEQNFISFTGVSYFYDGAESPAINNINAEIRRGEFIAVLGANGSGKSTLARHMNALLLPSRGEVLVNGIDTSNSDKTMEIRRLVGMVFQNPDNQLVAALVEEDVAFGPENLGLPPKEITARVEAALSATGLTELRNRPPHLLSGGQKQRLAIAGALAMRPDCLVLDEPTAMLDPGGRKEVLSLLLNLKKEHGMAQVFITHLMEEALLSDRVWVMARGQIIADGSPRQVFRDTKLLDDAGLEPTPAALMAARLKKAGWDLPDDILNLDELVDFLCLL